MAGRAIDALGAILYPPCCLLCSAPTAGVQVCATCRTGMRRIGPDDPLIREARRRLGAEAGVDGFAAAFAFEKQGPLQSALHQLKYGGMHSLGVWLGREAGDSIVGRAPFDAAEVLVPVPLHPARLRERGYNQAERIGIGISNVVGIAVNGGALTRVRNTRSQTKLTQIEREENVRGAFRVRGACGHSVVGKVVVLVDDVITTGATLAACAHVLREAGAGSVLAASVAVAEHTL